MKYLVDVEYEKKCSLPSDINEHLPTIKKYCDECESAYELGMRYIVSTWAMAASNLKKIISIDIKHPNEFGGNLSFLENACNEKGINFKFLQSNSLDVELEEVDLTFIDTLHVYDLCIQELNKYSKFTKKYIIMHDTTLFGKNGEIPGKLGLNYAIQQFLGENENWTIKEVYTNNNGLTILEKK